jgi:CDP-diacylglycerol--glycerol-3-phosphate 3-phosphatidyltransferase
VTAAAFALGLSAVVVVLRRSVGASAAGLWLLGAGTVAGYQLWFLRSTLGENHPAADGGREHGLLSTLGVANAVTLGRGWLFAGVAGFVLVVPPAGSGWRWVPAVWYGGGIALDWVDGALARSVGQQTDLGERLDMAFDTVGFLVAPLVGVVWGRLPLWYLSISAARYLFKAGRGWRRLRRRPVYDLPPSRVRRPLAALQMLFIATALVPVVPASVLVPLAAVVVTPSLAVFARDYLVVAGHLDADGRA